VIGPDVEIGDDTVVGAHCTITGPTRIGRGNHFHGHAAIGGDPQDKKFAGERTELIIGDRNVVREFTTISRGTGNGGGTTRIGNGNWLLAYVHIAHDCVVGSYTTFSNNAQLAGHVVIEDWVTMGGFTGVHQFCRVGAHAMIAAGAIVLQDVPPFVTVSGYPAKPHGTNNEGLRRRGFTAEQIQSVRRAYRKLYREALPLEDAKAALRSAAESDNVLAPLVAFLEAPGRGIVR